MKGAIIGDIVGSIYEFHNIKTKDFPLFQDSCTFTDDTIMTCAVANAFRIADQQGRPLYDNLIGFMQAFGRHFPQRGYGGHFEDWLYQDDPKPYHSFGNGAPMRVSSAGFLGDTPERARELGIITAMPSHNHPDSLIAAGLTAELIWRARHGESKEDLRKRAESFYQLPSLDEIRPDYEFDVSCQGTMPVALAAFFESTDFVDAIRNAISVGGDSDTIACITGAIAEAYYGVPESVWLMARRKLTATLAQTVDDFYAYANGETRYKTGELVDRILPPGAQALCDSMSK